MSRGRGRLAVTQRHLVLTPKNNRTVHQLPLEALENIMRQLSEILQKNSVMLH